MYIHMYTMARTIMVSNETYEKLTKIKRTNPSMSYSDVIISPLDNKKKTVGGLKEIINKIKLSKNDKKIDRDIKEGWSKWTKRYA